MKMPWAGAHEQGEIFLAEVSRQRAQVVAADGARIKSVTLHFLRSAWLER